MELKRMARSNRPRIPDTVEGGVLPRNTALIEQLTVAGGCR
jgi:hypothetical protein